MIHYQLRCGQDHEFDGWFRDSTAFDKQAERGLVACPTCGDVKVARAMMAPALATRAVELRHRTPPVPAAKDEARTGAVAGPMPDHMRAMLQRVRAEVEKNCDNVGERFAEEALRIHRGEAEPRAIYGDATPEQAEGLADEGVRVTRIPWVPRAEG